MSLQHSLGSAAVLPYDFQRTGTTVYARIVEDGDLTPILSADSPRVPLELCERLAEWVLRACQSAEGHPAEQLEAGIVQAVRRVALVNARWLGEFQRRVSPEDFISCFPLGPAEYPEYAEMLSKVLPFLPVAELAEEEGRLVA